MRVLYFSRDFTTHDRRFLQKLAQSRHEIFFLRLEDDGIVYESRALPEKIHSVEWRGGNKPIKTPEEWLRLMPDFCSVLDRIHPNLVHAGPVQSCGFMTALAGFHPFLLMSWGSDILVDANRDELWRWMTKYTLDRSDFLFCDCQAVRDKVQGISTYSNHRILQYSWGVDLNEFVPGPDRLGLRERLFWEDAFVVLSTRTWEPIYGLDVLLNAFQRAYAQNSKLRLVLLGKGSQANTIEGWIHHHGLDRVIYRPGIVSHEQLPDFFRACDLYLSCSYSDGSSISLLEAMATGLPVIVTDGAGNREWVVPNENGWLAPAGNIEGFSEFLVRASIMAEQDRERIKWFNRRKAEKSANWDINFSKLLELYETIEARLAR